MLTVPNSPRAVNNSREITLDEMMAELGYSQEMIDNPLDVELFKPAGQTMLTWTQKNSSATVTLGWYQGNEDHDLLQTDALIGIPSVLNAKGNPFGLYIIISYGGQDYIWYSETKHNQGEDHVKVYPLLEDGEIVENSYLLCWEDMPLGMMDDDFQDVIMKLEKVILANRQ